MNKKNLTNLDSPKVHIIILVIALLNGLAFVFLVPPWQHYDEPNHFEFAWLIADRRALPEPNEYDREMRRQVAQSMVEHGFFRDLDYLPDIDNVKPFIGAYSQTQSPPLYYMLASVPLMFLKDSPVDTQLYALRLLSLILYLFIILAAWGAIREITDKGNVLRVAVPLFMALLPAFTDVMTSVNNDVAAVFVSSFFIWGMIRCVVHGIRLRDLIWTIFFAVIGIWVRNSLLIALPIFILVILFKVFEKVTWRKWLFGGGVVVLLIAIFAVVSKGDAELWYRGSGQVQPTQMETAETPIGTHVLSLSLKDPSTPSWLPPIYQPIPYESSKNFFGKPATFGVWMWADSPITVKTPTINHGTTKYVWQVDLTKKPTFYAFPIKLENKRDRMWITFTPVKLGSQDVHVYLDGVVLATGRYPIQIPPEFDDADAASGQWGEKVFANVIRNGSFERSWFFIHPIVDDFVQKIMPDDIRLSSMLASIVDYKGGGWYYRLTLARLFRTFWAKFGWAHVPLLGHKPYRILLGFTILAVIGMVLGAFQDLHRLQWIVAFLFVLVLLGYWIPTLVRGSIFLAFHRVFIPAARYAYPSIICVGTLLTYGWSKLLDILKIRQQLQALIFFVVFLVIDLWSLASIYVYYHPL